MKKITFTLLIKNTAWAAILFASFPLFAQTPVPQIDNTFNHTGNAWLSSITFFIPDEQVIQPDGKILVCGYGRIAETDDLDGVVYRLNADGTLDSSFADNGLLIIDVDGTNDNAEDIVLLPDNKILVLLESTYRCIFVKLLPDGSYDSSFGNEGIVLGNSSNNELSFDMTIQADQKIIVIGTQLVSGKYRGVVRRYNSDGSSDSAYGTNGHVYITIDPTKNLELYDGALQPDGKFVTTGHYGVNAGSGFPVIRLNTDGSLDNDFSGDGIYFNTLGNGANSAVAESIVVNAQGVIYVGGTSPFNGENMMTVLSIKPNGTINPAFGSFGIFRIPFTIYASAFRIMLQPDEKILLGGYSFKTPTTTGMVYARLNANGTADNTFGVQGRYATVIEGGHAIQAILDIDVAPDGRLVGLGWFNGPLSNPGDDATAFVFRYILDITIKAEEPSPIFQHASLFPNPVRENNPVVVSYLLDNTCDVSIALYDFAGKEITTLMTPQQRSAGEQNETLNLPANLAAGAYFVLLSTDKGIKPIKFVKD